MAVFSGKFTWDDDLPDDEDVENAPEPRFSSDFGEQWQYMATKPVMSCICDALRTEDLITAMHDPFPEDHGWYSQFLIDGWGCSMHVYWAPDEDEDKCFEFVVTLRYAWFHRLIHRWQYNRRARALGGALARVFASTPPIERATFDQISLKSLANSFKYEHF